MPRSTFGGGCALDRQGLPVRIGHLTTVDMSLALLLATELEVDVAAGHEVFGISAAGPYVGQIEQLGVQHREVRSLTRSWDLRADARSAIELWRLLRELRLDVLHTHNPKTGILGRVLGRLARVPVVVNTCHGLWAGPEDRLVRRAAVVGLEAIAARFSHAELFQNVTDRDRLRWAIPADRAEVVGNGVDLDRFRFDAAGRRRVRREWGIDDREVLVGGVGRLVAEKGLPEMALAAGRLAGRARFVWVGPADCARADRFNEPMREVTLVGERHDMPAVYSAFDVFALPSHREGFSRSAMEAAACGRAMVLSDIRGCREIGEADREVLFVPPRDADSLAAALQLLIDEPRRRDRLGAAAERRARVHFDQRAVAARSLATYAAVARRRGLAWEC